MRDHRKYLMEDDQEVVRLDRKTDARSVNKQALWAGLKPGMRVADFGCGAGGREVQSGGIQRVFRGFEPSAQHRDWAKRLL